MMSTHTRHAPAPRRLAAAVASFALALIATGCLDLLRSDGPSLTRYQPPAIYQIWWDEVERCSGERGSMAALEFYRVEANGVWYVDGRGANGQYQRGLNSILIIADGVLDGGLVRHEMLHALTRGNGHTYAQFVRKCGDHVACSSSCLREAGVPADAPPIWVQGADTLEVSLRVVPSSPGRTKFNGRAVIVVTVRNPQPHAVAVSSTVLKSLSLWTTDGAFEHRATRFFRDGRSRYFAPGETRRFLFDLFLGNTLLSTAGLLPPPPTEPITYRARVAFAEHWLDSSEFVVRP